MREITAMRAGRISRIARALEQASRNGYRFRPDGVLRPFPVVACCHSSAGRHTFAVFKDLCLLE
jgi:hypothetical protein